MTDGNVNEATSGSGYRLHIEAVGLRQSDAASHALRLIGMMMQEAHTKGHSCCGETGNASGKWVNPQSESPSPAIRDAGEGEKVMINQMVRRSQRLYAAISLLESACLTLERAENDGVNHLHSAVSKWCKQIRDEQQRLARQLDDVESALFSPTGKK